jgi:ABC-2 type transport system ATP-binding protein
MGALTAYGITSLTVEPPSLESLFLRLYEDDAGPGATP